jgi:hypothetical protein
MALTSAMFENNTAVTTDEMGRIILQFHRNSEGSQLSKIITGDLVRTNAPLGIFPVIQP